MFLVVYVPSPDCDTTLYTNNKNSSQVFTKYGPEWVMGHKPDKVFNDDIIARTMEG